MKWPARALGLLVAVAAGAYFVDEAAGVLGGTDFSVLASGPVVAGFLVLVSCYLLQVPLTASIWRRLLAGLGGRLGQREAVGALAVSQFGKFLPGNVAQHVGRIAIARRLGCGFIESTLSLIYENVIAVIVGLHLAAVFLLWRPQPSLAEWLSPGLRGLLVAAGTACALVALFALPRLAAWLYRRRAGAQANPGFGISPRAVVVAYCMFVGNFIIMGVGVAALAHALAPAAGYPVLALTGAFAASWIAGMLTPGAPAGLGVREGVLLALLAGTLPATATVTLIVLLRVATTLGDLVQLMIGSWLLRGLGGAASPARADRAGPVGRSAE